MKRLSPALILTLLSLVPSPARAECDAFDRAKAETKRFMRECYFYFGDEDVRKKELGKKDDFSKYLGSSSAVEVKRRSGVGALGVAVPQKSQQWAIQTYTLLQKCRKDPLIQVLNCLKYDFKNGKCAESRKADDPKRWVFDTMDSRRTSDKTMLQQIDFQLSVFPEWNGKRRKDAEGKTISDTVGAYYTYYQEEDSKCRARMIERLHAEHVRADQGNATPLADGPKVDLRTKKPDEKPAVTAPTAPGEETGEDSGFDMPASSDKSSKKGN